MIPQAAQGISENERVHRGNRPIRLDKVLVVPKLSKLEYDMHRFGLNESEVLARYDSEGAPKEKILESHRAQHAALDSLRRIFSPQQFLARNEISSEKLAPADLVVAFGGDNHFQFVSHAIKDGLILGVNSDPLRSEGALVNFSADELIHILGDLCSGKYEVEEWTRLQGIVNGKDTPPVICEFYIGERERCEMSRYIISIHGRTEDQKGSGLLVATGAGSTGWYRSETRDLLEEQKSEFPRTSPEGRLFVTAPFHGRLTSPEMRQAILRAGEELVVRSLNDSDGVVVCDALERISFPRGAEARIRLAEQPLRVVTRSR